MLKKFFRIGSLELQIRQTLSLVENDEILNTMKLNETSNVFMQQRVLEIFEESLQSEKEMIIENLNQANSVLRAELAQTHQEISKQRNYFQNEQDALKSTINHFEDVIRDHNETIQQLERERNQLRNNIQKISEDYEHQLIHNDNKYTQNMQILHEEIRHLNSELEGLRNINIKFENERNQRDRTIEEMRNDIEVLRTEYTKIEKNYQNLISEHAAVTKGSDLLKESNHKHEQEIGLLRIQLFELKNELSNTENQNHETNRSNEELSFQIQTLQDHIKKVVINVTFNFL